MSLWDSEKEEAKVAKFLITLETCIAEILISQRTTSEQFLSPKRPTSKNFKVIQFSRAIFKPVYVLNKIFKVDQNDQVLWTK